MGVCCVLLCAFDVGQPDRDDTGRLAALCPGAQSRRAEHVGSGAPSAQPARARYLVSACRLGRRGQCRLRRGAVRAAVPGNELLDGHGTQPLVPRRRSLCWG
ncbi:hypothetical protein SPI_02824 [Niveomyces insectorum RCEF 264]|uniref:Uncharacterized protein n=1 Tax=Niveomyces insectorum RCEF 264 TaxID=1081102 RepID=A0A167WTE8_9HYPO|nr:hypothetical protein SPI_02824 [Niveomyces insectorum RCEF 264]